MYFVFVDYETSDGFYLTDDDATPQMFSSEAEAITAAKAYNGTSVVVRAVARLTEKTTHKVEKLK